MKKNLVLGMAKGYNWEILEPFVLSCRKNCPNAELMLYLGDISDFTRARLIQSGVLIKDFPEESNEYLIINFRWKIFADFLEIHSDDYEQIFFSDTRDVIFQGDVFKPFMNCKNYLGYTTEADDIGGTKTGDQTNYNWLVGCFDEEEAKKLSDRKIICCGTVIGISHEMKIFCYEMWNLLKEKNIFGYEQATMNYLVYENLLPIENLIEIDVYTGAIFTVALLGSFKVRDEQFLRGDDNIPAVVHQYDRYDQAVQLVDKIYRDKNFQFDGRFVDTWSTLEQTTAILRADKIGEATRLFMRRYLANSDFSTLYKHLIQSWKVAVTKSLSQTLELLELAIQDALKSVKIFSSKDLRDICWALKKSEENTHPIDIDFKIFIANTLWTVAENFLKSNDFDCCFDCIELIDKLNMPPNKNFYLFVEKANRLAGKNDEALAAHKKALKLS